MALINGKTFYSERQENNHITRSVSCLERKSIPNEDDKDRNRTSTNPGRVERKRTTEKFMNGSRKIERNASSEKSTDEDETFDKRTMNEDTADTPTIENKRRKIQSTDEEILEKSEYELLREKNIQERLDMLKTLNLTFPTCKKKSRMTRRKGIKTNIERTPTRFQNDVHRPASRRIRNLPPEVDLNETKDPDKVWKISRKKQYIHQIDSHAIQNINSPPFDHMIGGYLSKINQRIMAKTI